MSKTEITLIRHGTKVLIGDDIAGVVNGVMIRGERVLYEVAWWNGRTREEKWLDAHEVRTEEECGGQRIGFFNR